MAMATTHLLDLLENKASARLLLMISFFFPLGSIYQII